MEEVTRGHQARGVQIGDFSGLPGIPYWRHAHIMATAFTRPKVSSCRIARSPKRRKRGLTSLLQPNSVILKLEHTYLRRLQSCQQHGPATILTSRWLSFTHHQLYLWHRLQENDQVSHMSSHTVTWVCTICRASGSLSPISLTMANIPE